MSDEYPVWTVPKEWGADETCFLICGGESVRPQIPLIKQLRGRFIVLKHSVKIKPDADVLFIHGEKIPRVIWDVVPLFRGKHLVARGRYHPNMPANLVRIGRVKEHDRLCESPSHVCGYDMGTSGINLAYHFGARTVVLIGYDMTGGHWFSARDGFKAHVPDPPQEDFDLHMGPLPELAVDCKRKGLRVVNVSPISAVKCFEQGRLEDWV